RQQRPRRRFSRRRDRDRGGRFGGDNSNEPRNVGGDTGVETLDRQTREDAEAAPESGEQVQAEPEFGEGIIEISGKGFGFLRDPKRNFVQTPQDIFVTPDIVRRFGLRDGMWIYGETRRGSRGPQLTKLLTINGEEPPKYQGLRPFEELTTINPNKKIKLETVPDRYTTRIMDLMTPLGMGQRAGGRRPHHERRDRRARHGNPAKDFRGGAQHRRGRLAYHRRHCADRNRQPHG